MKPEDFDAETLALMYSYAGRDLFKRRAYMETLMDCDDGRWSLDDFITELEKLRKRVPEALRGSIEVEIDRYDPDWGGDSFKITYTRPETDEEYARQIQDAYQYAVSQLAGERAAYEALKRKYG